MTDKFTPGPWGHNPADNWIYAWRENGTQMLVAQGSSRSVSLEVRDANARLIAASPELLAALVEMTEQYTLLLRECMALPHKHLVDKAPEIRAALAAIAKATGAA